MATLVLGGRGTLLAVILAFVLASSGAAYVGIRIGQAWGKNVTLSAVAVSDSMGFIGGIQEHLGHTLGWTEHEGSRTVEFTTTTLDDILERSNAPSYIHYMSIDIEGAELEALKGLSLDRYTVGAFTIEHNWEEPKRSQILSLLSNSGYRRVFSRGRDDFYIHTSVEDAHSAE